MVSEQADTPNPDRLELSAPLPRGRHDLPPETVERHQRDRIVAAVAMILAEHGYAGLTVGRVIGLAHISRTTFYVHFSNRREAVIGSHEQIFDDFLAVLADACSEEDDGPTKVRAAIVATVDFAVSRPHQLQILSAGLLVADPGLAGLIARSQDRLAAVLAGIRPSSPYADQLPECTEQFLVAALAAVVARRLADGDAEQLRSLQPDLIELVLIPYYGLDEAARLSGRAVGKGSGHGRRT